jgi:hypothetical protein
MAIKTAGRWFIFGQGRGRADSHRRDTVASNRGVVAAVLLIATGLVVGLPGVGLEAASPGSEAEPRAIAPPDTTPAQTDRFFHVEWSAGVAGRGQSRIVGYVYNDYREDAVNVQLRISQLDESGRPVDSIVQPVGDTVRAGGRAFFELLVPGDGPSYRVAVASFAFAAQGEWRTLTTEQLLASAGFQKKVADSPEKLAHLETLTPARKLLTHRQDGHLYYVYADPETCKCLYVGTAAQYQLALEKRLESDQLEAMQEHLDDDAVIWNLWAPWPWF